MQEQEKRDRELFDDIFFSYAKKDILPSTSIPRKALLLAAVEPLLKERNDLGVIVEVGCGVGASARYLRGLYREYTGIDQSGKMIEAARAFNRDNDKAHFVAKNIKDVADEIPDHSADVILLSGALHHMTELAQVLRRLKRMLTGDGFILALEPQRGNPLIQAMRFIRGLVDKSYSRDQVFFSEKELRDLFSRGGFTGIEVRYLGFLSPPFAQVILRPQAVFAPLGRLTVAMDKRLHKRMPKALRKLSFNIALWCSPANK